MSSTYSKEATVASLQMSSELFLKKKKTLKIFLKDFKTFFVCSKAEYLYLKKKKKSWSVI